MNRRIPAPIAAAAAMVLALLFAPVAAAQTAEDEVLAALDRWSEVYSTATDAAEMQALYAPDAVFWGTGSRTPMVGADTFGPYFQAQFDNYTNRAHAYLDPVIRVYGDGAFATATGLYRFNVTPLAGGAPVEVIYRFSLAFIHTDDGWLIVQHHSSQLPQ
jgi:hypothetical protein